MRAAATAVVLESTDQGSLLWSVIRMRTAMKCALIGTCGVTQGNSGELIAAIILLRVRVSGRSGVSNASLALRNSTALPQHS